MNNKKVFILSLFLILILPSGEAWAGRKERNLLIFRSVINWLDSVYATLIAVDLEEGETRIFLEDTNTYVADMVWSPDGTRLAGATVQDYAARLQSPPEHGAEDYLDLCFFTRNGRKEICFEKAMPSIPRALYLPSEPRSWPIMWISDSAVAFVSNAHNDSLSFSVADISTHSIHLLQEVHWPDARRIDSLSWAPLASHCAVTVYEEGDSTIPKVYIIEVATGKMIIPNSTVQTPTWSADGRYITISGNFYDIEEEQMIHIELVDDQTKIGWNAKAWSHQGHRLAFWGAPLPTEYESKVSPQILKLYIYDLEQRDLISLVDENEILPPISIPAADDLTWSPDDQYLAFTKVDSMSGPTEIMVIRLEDKKIQIFSGDGHWNREPIWQPIH